MKKLHFCLKELRRRSGKVHLCLVWDQDKNTWAIVPPSLVQVFGHQQEDIIHRNF